MIEKILVLSTAHMPESEPDFGSTRVLYGEHDCVIPLPRFDDDEDWTPWFADWQIPIVVYALNQECTYIAFDRDADIDDQFETYNW